MNSSQAEAEILIKTGSNDKAKKFLARIEERRKRKAKASSGEQDAGQDVRTPVPLVANGGFTRSRLRSEARPLVEDSPNVKIDKHNPYNLTPEQREKMKEVEKSLPF